MDVLLYLIPAALLLGGLGLVAFLWALKSGQFDDLDGAAHRILFEEDTASPPRSQAATPADAAPPDDRAGADPAADRR
jgi:cbb3-type cytochrome oxidase maturation protein